MQRSSAAGPLPGDTVVQPKDGRQRLTYVWGSDVSPVLVCYALVKGLIAVGSLVVVFGESNSGKTFFALDIAVALASKRAWRGRKTQGGLVIYIAGEGVQGVVVRVAANRQRELLSAGAPLAIVTRAADLLNPSGDIDDLLKLIKDAESQSGEKCVLIVVDTLARAMPGGNENDAQPMGAVIANSDRLRNEIGAAVLLIHHAGKDATKGARGHSSLRAAVDTEILVEGRDGVRTATVVKQRDLPSGDVFTFELEQVVIGHDEDQQPVSTCIVRHEMDAAASARPQPLGKWQKTLLKSLEARHASSSDAVWTIADLRTIARELGATKSSAYDAANWLATSPFMTPGVGGVRLAYSP